MDRLTKEALDVIYGAVDGSLSKIVLLVAVFSTETALIKTLEYESRYVDSC